MFRQIAPLNVGDFVVNVRGGYGQIREIRGDRFRVEWTEAPAGPEWSDRSEIFFYKDGPR